VGEVEGKKSSFCEQKEAKKLCQLEVHSFIACALHQNKSFLLLFFKKDASSFP